MTTNANCFVSYFPFTIGFFPFQLSCSIMRFVRFAAEPYTYDSFMNLFFNCCRMTIIINSFFKAHNVFMCVQTHTRTNQRRICFMINQHASALKYTQHSLFVFEPNSQFYRCTKWSSFSKRARAHTTAKIITHGQLILLPLITMNIQKSAGPYTCVYICNLIWY